MLQLVNVGKTYLSKSKNKIFALKNVNLQFKDNGMVFILGKSGSGKSTLLNLVGGIDTPTCGEVIYRGESLKGYKTSDYEKYRNSEISFVFKGPSLSENLTVKENMSLSLRCPKNIDNTDKILSALQAVGLSKEYLTKTACELSYDDKQRVAIARAIAKDAKIIVADEPTCKSDDLSSREIWEILKTLSKTKLVVVVSRNEKSAEAYADRIIRLSDGEVVADNTINAEYVEDTENTETFSIKKAKKARLSNKICLKTCFKNLFVRKGRAIFTIVLSIVTVFFVLFGHLLLSYSTEKMAARFIEENNVEYFSVRQGAKKKFMPLTDAYSFNRNTQRYLSGNSDYILDNCVDGKQDILDFGLTFDGEVLSLDENSFYITDIGLHELYNRGYTRYGVLTDEGEVADISTLYDAKHWVGRYIVYKDSSNEKGYKGNPYRIAGVVDTSAVPQISQGALPDYFCQPNFDGNHYMYDFSCNYKNNVDVYLNFGKSSTAEQFTFKSKSYNVREVLTKGGMWRYDETSGGFTSTAYEFDLKDDEIMISYELCNKIFGMKSKLYYTAQDFQDLQLPEFLGQYFDLSFSDYFTNKELLNVGKMKIAGVFFTDSQVYECVVSPVGTYKQLFENK